MIDDPVKNRAEAESTTFRDSVWDWFNDDIYTRLEPDASIILIQTRWHEDDLAGWLLKEMEEEGGEQWEVVNLPALAEAVPLRIVECEVRNETGDVPAEIQMERARNKNIKRNPHSAIRDPLGRREGQALCPQRFDEIELERIRKKLGPYSFSALYQQRPIPLEGSLFKLEWFKNIVDKAPEGLRWKRGYDLAVSIKTSADHTASFRCAKDGQGNLYIADGFRKRIEFPEQLRYITQRMLAEPNTEHGIELALHGQAFVQLLRRELKLSHIPFRGVRAVGDKFTRALTWANLAEEGKVFLVCGGWIHDFIEEACRFTGRGDVHDDQIDAVSLAVGMIAGSGSAFHTF